MQSDRPPAKVCDRKEHRSSVTKGLYITMSFKELASIDLYALSKVQLKSYVKLARSEWNKPIDLRSANSHDLIEYLAMYLMWKAQSEDAIAEAPEAIAEEDLDCPDTFNEITRASIAILLNRGTSHGNTLTSTWIQEILGDCQIRGIALNRVKEPLLKDDSLFYGLAGIAPEQLNIFRRIMTSPDEFDIVQDAPDKPDFYQRIGSAFGADAMCEIAIYHRIRSNLRHLQTTLGISALHSRCYAIRDKLFSVQDYEWQLELMPRDRVHLKAEVPRIVSYFLSLVGDYDLFRELDDESVEPLGDVDLHAIALTAEYAWINSESYNWQPQPNGGYRGQSDARIDPDSISLSLQIWDKKDNDFSSYYRVCAEHRDKSRFPWKSE